MPGIVDRLLASEATRVFAHDPALLADLDPIGIGADLRRTSDGAGRNRVAVVVEAHEARLRHRDGQGMEAVEAAPVGNKAPPLGFERLPHRPVSQFGMAMRLGEGDRPVEQPGVQLLVALHPKARREEALAHQPNLVLDLALLPARRRRAGHRIDEVVPAHLEKAPVVGAIAAHEDRIHRGLHIVVDPAGAGAAEEGERPVVGVEHHLLALAGIGPHEQHPGMAQADMGDLHLHRRAVDQHDLVAPVELVGLAGVEAQRYEGRCRQRGLLALPASSIAAHRIVAALVAEPAQRLEDPDQRQPLTRRTGFVDG